MFRKDEHTSSFHPSERMFTVQIKKKKNLRNINVETTNYSVMNAKL